MLSVTKRFKFDAAHHLPYYEGKCFRPHGHRFFLDVSVTGNIIKEGHKQGMIIDFVDLKKIVAGIVGKLDHSDLNAFFDNPTAEEMLLFIVHNLYAECIKHKIILVNVKLWETEDSYAEWRNNEIS